MAKRDPLFVDADPATSLPSFSSLELRSLSEWGQAGVFRSTDFKVTANGSTLSVDSAAGRAAVQASAGGVILPGKYVVADDAAENSATFEGDPVPVNASANPRLDAVVLHVFDNTLDGSGRRQWVRQYVPGVATAGITLGGALPALPTNSLLIAEVLVPGSNPTTIPAANVRDRRPWATGLFNRLDRAASVVANTASIVQIDSVLYNRRCEFTGAPVEVWLVGNVTLATASTFCEFWVYLDGVAVANSKSRYQTAYGAEIPGGSALCLGKFTPTAGSHLVDVRMGNTNAGNATLGTNSSMAIEEKVRPVADNT